MANRRGRFNIDPELIHGRRGSFFWPLIGATGGGLSGSEILTIGQFCRISGFQIRSLRGMPINSIDSARTLLAASTRASLASLSAASSSLLTWTLS